MMQRHEVIRVVVVSDEDGSMEDVYITDYDFDTPAEDFCIVGKQEVISDNTYREVELPEGIPLNTTLRSVR